MSPPQGSGALEEVPPEAAQVFGARLGLARDYAIMLATVGVERGLIGPREAPRLWSRHLLNSAVIATWLPEGAEVIDLGSGAGLPGIPLALARPDLRLTLVEPMARRASFLDEAVSALALDVVVRRARGEELAAGSADAVVARAVAPLERLIPLALPLLRKNGRLIALKGSAAQEELDAAKSTLAPWPRAQSAIVRAAVGCGTATAVIISLGEMLADSAPSDGGGSA